MYTVQYLYYQGQCRFITIKAKFAGGNVMMWCFSGRYFFGGGGEGCNWDSLHWLFFWELHLREMPTRFFAPDFFLKGSYPTTFWELECFSLFILEVRGVFLCTNLFCCLWRRVDAPSGQILSSWMGDVVDSVSLCSLAGRDDNPLPESTLSP